VGWGAPGGGCSPTPAAPPRPLAFVTFQQLGQFAQVAQDAVRPGLFQDGTLIGASRHDPDSYPSGAGRLDVYRHVADVQDRLGRKIQAEQCFQKHVRCRLGPGHVLRAQDHIHDVGQLKIF
jgi:hypothetical protein